MMLIEYSIIFFFGTLFGSFFYTLSLRAADDDFSLKSLITPSRCPGCRKNIHWIFLLPIVGYILLRGRCSLCSCRISIMYPLMETMYGAFAVFVYYLQGAVIESLVFFLILSLAITISLVDIRSFRIPGSLTAVLAILALYPASMEVIHGTTWNAFGGMLLLGGFFILVLLLFPGGFGGGDIKFSAVIGLIVGFEQSIVVLETALVSGALFGIIYAVVTGKGLRIKIPFAPFLTLGLFVSIFFGREILMIYNRIMY